MRYGYFDNEQKEYVVDKVDTPVSWTNYIGVQDMCAVLNQAGSGYSFYKTPQYHRISRFRPNTAVDRPGHYVYIKDLDSGEYWSISWQPVTKDLSKATYECRHGLSYSKYSCHYQDISASQTVFIPIDDPVELWDVCLSNRGSKPRNLAIYSYVEFSFHHIDMDNQNFQMSLYASGSSYEQGIIEYDLFYEEEGYQWFGSNFAPDAYDCLRDQFIGLYHDEKNPIALEGKGCSNSSGTTGNHCAVLSKKLVLQPGEESRFVFMLGEGQRQRGIEAKAKYSILENVEEAFRALAAFWQAKLDILQVKTPNQGMNTSLNIWNLYQAEVNIMFSRFASFIEVGGRTGLGYRDTAQDSMTVIHSNPQKCKQRMIELLRGLTSHGYGLHLFQPEWFDPAVNQKKASFKSPTVIPTPNKNDIIHGIEDACSDDALWLVGSINEYLKETGDFDFLDQSITYADEGSGTVYEHLKKIINFSFKQVGKHGICKGLRADWNDCLNLGGGESAMVSFLHFWAIQHFLEIAKYKKQEEDCTFYTDMANQVKQVANQELWDGKWYARGITASGRKIGTQKDVEGKVHMESNTWAVLSGVADREQGLSAMNSVYEYLFTPYGLMLNAPSYTQIDDEIGFVTRVYPGIKENGAIFSHPNPWAWCAEAQLGRGDRAMELYNALLPYHQNDQIEIRGAEPYSYCQFVVGKDHPLFGQAKHPFMTGTGGWAYFAATRFLLGIYPEYDSLRIDPCIPEAWDGFEVTRIWREATYHIKVDNSAHMSKGVKSIHLNGKLLETGNRIYMQPSGSIYEIVVKMG